MGPKPTAGRGVGAGKNAAAVPPKGAASANTTKGGAGMSAKVEPATKATGASKPIPSYMRATKAANQETKPKFVYKDIKNSAAALAMRAVQTLKGKAGAMQRQAAEDAAMKLRQEEERRKVELAALIAALREKAAAFSAAQLRNFSAKELASLDADTLSVFTREQIQSLSADMVAKLSGDQIKKMSKEQIMFLKAEQLAALSVDQISSLSDDQLASFNQGQLTRMPAATLQALQAYAEKRMQEAKKAGGGSGRKDANDPEADSGLGFMKVWALTKTQMEQLPEAQKAHMKVIDPRELAKQKQQQHRAQEAKVKAKAVDVKKLDADSLKAVPPEVIGQLSPEQMKHISARQLAAMSAEQLEAFTEEQMASLPPELKKSMKQVKEQKTKQTAERREQVKSIRVKDLSGAGLRQMDPSVIGLLTPGQIKELAPHQLQAMTKAQLASFTPDQLAALPPETWSSSAATILSAMSKEQLESFTPQQLGALPPELKQTLKSVVDMKDKAHSIAAWTPDSFLKLSAVQVQAIEGRQLATLSEHQLRALPASAVAALTAAQLAALSPQQVAHLSPAQLAALSPQQMLGLSPAHFAGLSADQLSAIAPEKMQALAELVVNAAAEEKGRAADGGTGAANKSDEGRGGGGATALAAFFGLDPSKAAGTAGAATGGMMAQLAQLKEIKATGAEGLKNWAPDKFKSMTAMQVQAISKEQVSSLGVAQIASLPPHAVSAMSASQLGGLAPDQLAAMSAQQIQALSPAQLAALSPEQLLALSPSHLKHLGTQQQKVLNAMKEIREIGGMIRNWDKKKLAGLDATQVGALSPSQLSLLSPQQLSALSPTALVQVGAWQLKLLEPEQLAALSANQFASLFSSPDPALWAARVDVLKSLSREQLASFSLVHLQRLTSEMISYLTNGAAADPQQAWNLYQALFHEELAKGGPRPKKLDLPWRTSESAEAVLLENVREAQDPTDEDVLQKLRAGARTVDDEDVPAADISDARSREVKLRKAREQAASASEDIEEEDMPSSANFAARAASQTNTGTAMDALPAEECMEDDMPMNSPMDPTTPPRTDDEPAAECMEELVVLLVDDPEDCEFFPEMEAYVPTVNAVHLDRDIEEEHFEAYQEDGEDRAATPDDAHKPSVSYPTEGPAEELEEDMMPEAPQPPPPTKYVVPDIDKTVAEDPEEVLQDGYYDEDFDEMVVPVDAGLAEEVDDEDIQETAEIGRRRKHSVKETRAASKSVDIDEDIDEDITEDYDI